MIKVFDKKLLFSICGIILIFLLIFTIYMENQVTYTNGNALSNKKIGWGIKREKDHKRPDVGKENAELMEKYDGIYIGNEDKKYIYLTFDEGYEAGYTEQILDVLKENDVKATFFITAHYLNTAEDLVKRMVAEGHIVGNHTVHHKSLPDISDEEIRDEVMKLHQSIYEKTGYEMKYIRPPKGEYSERTLAVTKELGYTNVMWTFGYLDYDENVQKGTEYAKKIVLDNLHNGEIMLLHGNSKDNANALDSIIKEAKADGYEFKSLDEFER